jgi:hypothetical protein
MAEVVQALGRGGQRLAEKVLGWNRKTIRKGAQELASGPPVRDRFQDRGRKKFEEHLPLLLDHIRAIVEPRCQADPTLRSARIYTPLTAEEVRQRLRTQFRYKEAKLPCVRTLRTKLNVLGYQLRKVKKCRPLKKIPQTDAIFEEVHAVNQAADQEAGVLRSRLAPSRDRPGICPIERSASCKTKLIGCATIVLSLDFRFAGTPRNAPQRSRSQTA